MRRPIWFLVLITFTLATPLSLLSTAANPGALLGAVADVVLPTTDEQKIALLGDADADFTVICFLGTECPLARVYGPRLSAMADRFRPDGVSFIGVNSNIQDSMDDLRRYVREHKIGFPVAKDYDRTVAVSMNATRTPEVFVVDRTGKVQYRGRIDNQYQPGIARSEATSHELRDALQQLIGGKPVAVPSTQAVGCLIALPKSQHAESQPADASEAITYCNQISRVLQKHCVECHRDGEIGPFVLDDYDEVVGWSDMMVEVIDQQRMPPWHASPKHGSFANARDMPEADKQLIRDWVDAGSPFGEIKNLPPKPVYASGWRLPRPPDCVLEMSQAAFQVPADGVVEYQYFVVDPKFTEDKWISAAQVIPGNAAVVHHCIVFIRPPDGSSFSDFGMLSAYVPGQRSTTLPQGYARRVAAGSRIVFQMHYTPNGQPQQDITKIGLVFADKDAVTHEVVVVAGIEQEFEIPPNAKQTVSGRFGNYPTDGLLLAIAPHMHLRGESFRMTAETSEGSETLLDVPTYDFNWQHSYELSEPMPLSDAKLRFEATFDNSAANPTNPDPSEYVTWGDQTWQEMAVVFLSVAKPLSAKPAEPEMTADERHKLEADNQQEAQRFAQQYIKRFDRNGDGQLSFRELPTSVRISTRFDHDNDGVITTAEIEAESLYRLESR